MIPRELYGTADALLHGKQRARGYLMRTRMEYLVNRFDEAVGLRRATHVGALIEVVYQSYQDRHGTGFFSKELKDKIDVRLKGASLQPQEQHFRNIDWWNKLDRVAARGELASNLDRLISDEPTVCLCIGMELHALLDAYMKTGYGGAYESVITDERLARSSELRGRMEFLDRMMLKAAA